MKHPFATLEPEYVALLATMRVTRLREVENAARKLMRPEVLSRHTEISRVTGVPAALLATLFEREASSDFTRALGQGDRWDRVSTNVPKGKGPFASWDAAAIYYVRYDHLNDNSSPWSMPYACWKGEAWNGFGPRDHGIHTGYLWAGTNHYARGKYVRDGAWDSSHVDVQLGIVPVMLRMIEINASLAFGTSIPATDAPAVVPKPVPVPIGVGGGGKRSTAWIQAALNALNENPPLREDNSYGRITRAAVRSFQRKHKLVADGLVGPITTAALEHELSLGGIDPETLSIHG